MDTLWIEHALFRIFLAGSDKSAACCEGILLWLSGEAKQGFIIMVTSLCILASVINAGIMRDGISSLEFVSRETMPEFYRSIRVNTKNIESNEDRIFVWNSMKIMKATDGAFFSHGACAVLSRDRKKAGAFHLRQFSSFQDEGAWLYSNFTLKASAVPILFEFSTDNWDEAIQFFRSEIAAHLSLFFIKWLDKYSTGFQ